MRSEGRPRVLRRSPVGFRVATTETELRDGWEVVLAYEEEGDGPWLVDLSHRRRWDFQDPAVDARRPFGLEVPGTPGEVRIQEGLMISRMNRTQVAIAHVGPGEIAVTPDGEAVATPGREAVAMTEGEAVVRDHPAPREAHELGITETTDAHAWLAVVGPRVREVLEHVSSLDLFAPGRRPAFLTQGPVLHVPCQVTTRGGDCVLITLGRAYAQTFAEAMLHAARHTGLVPGGERRYTGGL